MIMYWLVVGLDRFIPFSHSSGILSGALDEPGASLGPVENTRTERVLEYSEPWGAGGEEEDKTEESGRTILVVPGSVSPPNVRAPITVVSEPNISKGLCLSCENLQSEEVRGYASWEESCLVKFSEFLGFQTIGHEKEFINMLRQLKDKKNLCGSMGQLGYSKCDREMKKLACTINYNGRENGKGSGRDRGNFRLKHQ